ncbi:MAG: HYR domain-containing protein, partial [Verrucomicrobia subdivision 3 bacterium]|nr:HYR domain-containing protein [Limisphaerales bacterium]
MITCPSNIVVTASSGNGAVLSFSVSATDVCDSNPTINCAPSPGSSFPLGNTSVTCTATDDCGNRGSCNFNVTVVPRPLLVSAGSLDGRIVGVCFDSPVDGASAENPANYYFIRNPDLNPRIVACSNAVLRTDGSVMLSPVDPFLFNPQPDLPGFLVVASNILAARSAPTAAFDNGQITGQVLGLRVVSIGDVTGSAFTCSRDSLEITTLGNHTSPYDDVQFVYRTLVGDFDVRARLGAHPGMASGLMTRQGFDPSTKMGLTQNSSQSAEPRYEAAIRLENGGAITALGGAVPAPRSNAWVRLKRTGPMLSTYYSNNGSDWSLLGVADTSADPFSPTQHVGFAVGPFASNQLALTRFHDFAFEPPPSRNPPVIFCPSSQFVWTCSTGVIANYSVSAAANCGSNVTTICEPPNGSFLAVGNHDVTCTALDDCGQTVRCSFTVAVVRDATPPVITCPSNLVVRATFNDGAPEIFTISASDTCDPDPSITCIPASGSVFPPGTNTVLCRTLDACGNDSSCSFTVTVIPPSGCIAIQCSSNIVTQCQSVAGSPVTFTVTASNHCGGAATIICEPASGGIFPVGSTLVLCTATDGRAETNRCTFFVEVEDERPPVLNCPSNLVVEAQGADGAIVQFHVSATDNSDTNVSLYCRPPSDSVFPTGMTQVICLARDDSGNEDICGFSVTVMNSHLLTVSLSGSNIVLLWSGKGAPEVTTSLLPPIQWSLTTGTIIPNGSQQMMVQPVETGQHFYRIASEPLAPPPDEDKDGVPDSLDRCPATPRGQLVDPFGCSYLQLVTRPEIAIAPAETALQESIDELRHDGIFSNVVSVLQGIPAEMRLAASLIRSGEIANGVDTHTRAVEAIELAHMLLRQLIRQLEADPPAEPLATGYGDVTEHDLRIIMAHISNDRLSDTIDSAHQGSTMLAPMRQSITGQSTARAMVMKSDDATRQVTLDNGRTLVIAGKFFPGVGWSAGTTGAVTTLDFNDGSGVVLEITDVNSIPKPQLANCMELRIAPVQRFEPGTYGGSYMLHHPSAYSYEVGDDTWLYLEQGMRLAAIEWHNCPVSLDGAILRYRLKLDLSYISTIDYKLKNVTLASDLAAGGTVDLPSDIDPNSTGTVTVTSFRRSCFQAEPVDIC